MKQRILGPLALVALTAGCAPQFIDVPPAQRKSMWIETDAVATHGAIGRSEQSEIVLTDVLKDKRLSPEERVVWVAGVDVKNSNLQRTVERIDEAKMDANSARISSQSNLIEGHTFAVVGNALSAAGQMNIHRFKAKETDRFYVEFLSEGEMTEEKVTEITAAWKQLAVRLKERGLNTSNVVLGGSKYKQPLNAIVLVKVGK